MSLVHEEDTFIYIRNGLEEVETVTIKIVCSQKYHVINALN